MKHITDWIEQSVCHKMLYTDELIYTLENGQLEGVYSDRIAFGNLLRAKSAFQLDMFIATDEKIYEKGRSVLHRDYSGISLFRYEFAERQSSGELTGTFRVISGSAGINHAAASASGIYNLRLQDDRLSWAEQQLLYRDQAGIDGCRAVAFDASCSFYFENGKLCFFYDGKVFNYDVASHSRTLSNDDMMPVFTAKER